MWWTCAERVGTCARPVKGEILLALVRRSKNQKVLTTGERRNQSQEVDEGQRILCPMFGSWERMVCCRLEGAGWSRLEVVRCRLEVEGRKEKAGVSLPFLDGIRETRSGRHARTQPQRKIV